MVREESVSSVTVRLGRRQTPYSYSTVEAIERDLAAAHIRLAQMTKDQRKQAADVVKMEEAASRLRRNVAALAEKRRAGRKAGGGGATPRQDDEGA